MWFRVYLKIFINSRNLFKHEYPAYAMKKGQSSVISTVLLILIVVVIGGIITVFSTGFIKKQTEKQELLDVANKLGIKIAAIYWNNIGSGGMSPPPPEGESFIYGYIILTRTDNEELPLCNAAFVFYLNNGNTINYETEDVLPDPGMNKQYKIDYSRIEVTDASQIEKVEIQAKCPKGTTPALDEGTEIKWY